MENKRKKPAIKSTVTTKVISEESKKKTKKVENKSVDNEILKSNITKLESAYVDAISGKMKFGEVKSIFKQLHKEIKKSSKV